MDNEQAKIDAIVTPAADTTAATPAPTVTPAPDPEKVTAPVPSGPSDPKKVEDNANELKALVEDIKKDKPKATPEGVKDAAEKRKRGRPSAADKAAREAAAKGNASGLPPVDAPSFDPEDIERAANSTSEQIMLMEAMVLGDTAYLPETFKAGGKNMTAEESIRAAWKAYYKRYGVKEIHPALMIALAHGTHIVGTTMGNKRLKKKVKSRFSKMIDKVKGFFKAGIMKMRGEI